MHHCTIAFVTKEKNLDTTGDSKETLELYIFKL